MNRKGKTNMLDSSKIVRKVEQSDMASNAVIRVWDSVNAASRYLNISMTAINDALMNKTDHAGGFCWQYISVVEEDEEDEEMQEVGDVVVDFVAVGLHYLIFASTLLPTSQPITLKQTSKRREKQRRKMIGEPSCQQRVRNINLGVRCVTTR